MMKIVTIQVLIFSCLLTCTTINRDKPVDIAHPKAAGIIELTQ